jgi:hypothetical protein
MVDEKVRRDAAGLEDVIRAAAKLADQARELATNAGSVTEREIAMLTTIAEDVRDKVIAQDRLKLAREGEVLQGLRRSAHRTVDLAFDAAGTLTTAAIDVVGAILNTPRTAANVESQKLATDQG